MRDEYLEDLYELFHNLQDDLTLDLKEGENGYSSYKESYRAVRKFTLRVLNEKIKKWEDKNNPKEKEEPKKDNMEEAMKEALGDIQ